MQADYILDTRLRALRRLEEMELRKERDELVEERAEIEALLADEAKQWKAITAQIRELKKTVGAIRALGKRRTTFEDAPEATRHRSRRGDDRARADHRRRLAKGLDSRAEGPCVGSRRQLQFKGDDALDVSFFAQTTSKILVLATNGKVFTLDAAKLPGGRGHGEPIRLMADIDEDATIVAGAAAYARMRCCCSSPTTGAASSSRRTISSRRRARAAPCSTSIRRRS